jgi:hypothetical protein
MRRHWARRSGPPLRRYQGFGDNTAPAHSSMFYRIDYIILINILIALD